MQAFLTAKSQPDQYALMEVGGFERHTTTMIAGEAITILIVAHNPKCFFAKAWPEPLLYNVQITVPTPTTRIPHRNVAPSRPANVYQQYNQLLVINRDPSTQSS